MLPVRVVPKVRLREKIAKVANNVATFIGGSIFMDISSINVKSTGVFTNCIWRFFLKQNSDLTMHVWNWIYK
jgi:hypothetical protein